MAQASGVANRTAGQIENRFRTMDARLSGIGRTFLAGLGAGALSQLPRVIGGIVKELADLGDLADRVGLTTDRLQELNFQAKQTGSSAETMGNALEQFGKRLGEARTGAGDLFKLLKANGVALDELAKMDVNEALTVFIDLIGNAKDEADALTIAAKGFGRGAGAEMALTFADGADGAKRLADEAQRTWQIIREVPIREAQEIDDAFDQFAGTIATIVKGGLLDFLATTRRELEAISKVLDAVRGRKVGTVAEQFRGGSDIQRNIDATFEEVEKLQRNDKLLAALQKKLSVAPGGDEGLGTPSSPTVLPPAPSAGGSRSGSRSSAISDIERQRKAVLELIDDLEFERKLIGLTDEEREVEIALRRAGAAATAEQRAQIEALVAAGVREQEALDAMIDRMDELRDAAGGALSAFNDGIQRGEGLLDALRAALVSVLETIVRIAEQQAITSLLGGAGTPGGGLLGTIAGSLLGGRAPAIASVASVAAAARGAAAPQQVQLQISAAPSPLLVLGWEQRAQQAESRAVARGPAVARDHQRRFAVP